jgi:hypothetical protein
MHAIIDGKWSTMTRLSAMHLVLLSTHAASGDEPSDLTVTFPGGSGGWESEAAARPATRACGGLNSGPEYGSALLDPLRLGSYRGKGCLEYYDALAESGVRTIACSAAEEYYYLVNGSDTNPGGPGAGGNWSRWDAMLDELLRLKRTRGMERLAMTVWNEPNSGAFWHGTTDEYFELWRRTVLYVRRRDPTVTILGPTIDDFDLGYLAKFVNFSVARGVMPDVLDWHAWGGAGAMGPAKAACPCLYPAVLPCACAAAVGNGSDLPAQHAAMRAWLKARHPDHAAVPFGNSEMVPMAARLFAGLTLGALAGLERAGAVFAAHSNWGEPDLNLTRCGFCELVTCDDQPPVGPARTRSPRATYQVYAAYGNTSGVMVPVERRCDDCDAFASYDAADATAWLALGRYDFRSAAPRNVTLHATGLPPTLVAAASVRVELARISNRLQDALLAPLPMGARLAAARPSATVAGGYDIDLQLEIEPHDVWTVRLRRPTPQ